jgi:RHS repeat-associated protein
LRFSQPRSTGKERDTESGNDYFGARYYSSAAGQFMTPDWSAKVEPVPYSKLDDPQTLNLYAYVTNNPMTRVDADGHAPMSWGGFENCGEEYAAVGCGAGSQTAADMAQKSASDGQQQAQQQGTVPVIVGQRATKNIWTKIFSLGLAKHSYFIVEGDMVQVLGNPGSSHNQQVRINDPTRAQRGKERTINVSQAQADALVSGSEYFAQHTGSGLNQSDYAHPCPTCSGGQEGYNFLLHNSNSFVYNMLSTDPAGSIPPGAGPAITPGWAKKPDDWYPNP